MFPLTDEEKATSTFESTISYDHECLLVFVNTAIAAVHFFNVRLIVFKIDIYGVFYLWHVHF